MKEPCSFTIFNYSRCHDAKNGYQVDRVDPGDPMLSWQYRSASHDSEIQRSYCQAVKLHYAWGCWDEGRRDQRARMIATRMIATRSRSPTTWLDLTWLDCVMTAESADQSLLLTPRGKVFRTPSAPARGQMIDACCGSAYGVRYYTLYAIRYTYYKLKSHHHTPARDFQFSEF